MGRGLTIVIRGIAASSPRMSRGIMTQQIHPGAAPHSYRWLRWTTPNQLTLARIAAVPVLVALIYWHGPVANTVALALFILACLTDYWDGNLARVRKEVTPIGKLLDPIADKMLVTASLVMLVAQGHADAVPTIIILLREFAVSGLRQVAAIEGVAIAAVPGAKAKTILQMVATGALLMNHDPFGVPLHALGRGLLWLAAAWTVWTGYGYLADYYRQNGAKLFARK
jgi:CDP-diacylglycerol--glycerol-3-phosphate 3-phosphatidyltransferase